MHKNPSPYEVYRPLLNVYILWHPKDEDEHSCRKIANAIYSLLNRDMTKPYSIGMGIPTYYRFTPISESGPTPLPIDLEDAEQNAIYALVGPEFVMDRALNDYCSDLCKRINARGNRDIVIPMGLTRNALKVKCFDGVHAVRLHELTWGLKLQKALRKVSITLCDLLSPRKKTTDPEGRESIEKLKLFISHTKRSDESLKLAEALRRTVESTEIDRYFDSVDTRPGRYFVEEIMKHIDTSALVALRSDAYSSSPWCCMEVIEAKRLKRPMVIVDCLVDVEKRNLPFLGNLPSIRFDPDPNGCYCTPEMQARLEKVIDFAVTENLRFLYIGEKLKHLKSQTQFDWLPENANLLARAPEPIDIMEICKRAGPWTVIYDGETLAPQIQRELERANLKVATPSNYRGKTLEGLTVGVSVSESPELETMGLSLSHLRAAMRDIGAPFLEKGAVLAYGGDLRPGGFTKYLFELSDSLRSSGQENLKLVLNFLAWPGSMKWSADDFADHNDVAEFINLDPPKDALVDGLIQDKGATFMNSDSPELRFAKVLGLTEMRMKMMEHINARIILGGKLKGYSGKYPGLVEEALLAIRSSEPFPLYLLGGFGGAAAAVIKALKGSKPKALTEEFQCEEKAYKERMEFYNNEIAKRSLSLEPIDYTKLMKDLEEAGIGGLRNGLNDSENEQLFGTQNMELAVKLIEEGLKRVYGEILPK